MRIRAVALIASVLASTACESVTHEKELAQAKHDEASARAELQRLQGVSSELAQLQERLTDSKTPRSFEEAMIGFAAEIVPVLSAVSRSQSAPAVAVRAITLSGRKRVPHEKASVWVFEASCPISEVFDNFGPYVEGALTSRITEGGKAIVSDSAPFVLSGSYQPDTVQTVRIDLGLSRNGTSDILSSFVKRIDRSSVNRVYLHFLDQVQ